MGNPEEPGERTIPKSASRLKWLRPGSFQGHPDGNKWYARAPNMGPKPLEPKSGSRFHVEAARIPEYVPPPVLLPHGKLGNSASGVCGSASSARAFVLSKKIERCAL